MFILIWATLLVSARGSSANTEEHQTTNETEQVTVTPKPQITNQTARVTVTQAAENATSWFNLIEDTLTEFWKSVKQPMVIIAFFIGIVLSSTICCLARKCHRRKQRSSENMVETLEMVTADVAALMDSGDVERKEVEYSNIDFSRRIPTGPRDTQETTETEYAEIKKDGTEDRQDVGVGDDEKFEGSEEEVVMIGDDKDTKQCLSPEREDVADVAVCSSVNEIMPEI